MRNDGRENDGNAGLDGATEEGTNGDSGDAASGDGSERENGGAGASSFAIFNREAISGNGGDDGGESGFIIEVLDFFSARSGAGECAGEAFFLEGGASEGDFLVSIRVDDGGGSRASEEI